MILSYSLEFEFYTYGKNSQVYLDMDFYHKIFVDTKKGKNEWNNLLKVFLKLLYIQELTQNCQRLRFPTH